MSLLSILDPNLLLSKSVYRAERDALRIQLFRAQRRVREAGLPVLIILEGWNYAGKSGMAQFLVGSMDPRGFKVHSLYPPTPVEQQFPFAKRYVERAPRDGEITFFIRSWYSQVLTEQVQGDGEDRRDPYRDICDLEESLADEGALIVKFWLHIGEGTLRKRRRKLKNETMWHDPDDPAQHRRYDQYTREIEEMVAVTSKDHARWYPVVAEDRRYARVAVAAKLLERIDAALQLREHPQEAPPIEVTSAVADLPLQSPLATVDLSLSVEPPDYDERMNSLQREIGALHRQTVAAGRAVVFVFEGWDAAGKGGVIRRLRQRLHPRFYEVHAIAAPAGEDASHHYLWRFWRRLPPDGHWGIFDRSWYGRVLVERVEGFASIEQWRRAYEEIRYFERTLVDHGTVVLKFWLHLSPEEQLRRFEERQKTEYKRYKITDEDWRNRARWDDYARAVDDMILRTSTPGAPWTVVPGENKHFARLSVLETTVKTISAALD